jgi:hypothetical protein
MSGAQDPQGGWVWKVRSLGIPTVADRVVQAGLKLVLEPMSRSAPRRLGRTADDDVNVVPPYISNGSDGWRVSMKIE